MGNFTLVILMLMLLADIGAWSESLQFVQIWEPT